MKLNQLVLKNFTKEEVGNLGKNLEKQISDLKLKTYNKKSIEGLSYFLLYFIDVSISVNMNKFIKVNNYLANIAYETAASNLRQNIYFIHKNFMNKKEILDSIHIKHNLFIFTKEVFKSLLDDLGYKKDNFEDNEKIISEVLSVIRAIGFHNNGLYTITNSFSDFKSYPELIYMTSKERMWNFPYIMERLKSSNNFHEKLMIYSNYFRQTRNYKELDDFIQIDLNDPKVFEKFEKSKIGSMKSLAEIKKGSAKINIKNLLNTKNNSAEYTCSLIIDYHKVRSEIKTKDKSKVTNLFYKMVSETTYSTGVKNEVLVLIVKSDFPIKTIELENYISENFTKWISEDIEWEDAMVQFISLQRSKILYNKITKIDENKTVNKIINQKKKI